MSGLGGKRLHCVESDEVKRSEPRPCPPAGVVRVNILFSKLSPGEILVVGLLLLRASSPLSPLTSCSMMTLFSF
jgi:hypothetical protein